MEEDKQKKKQSPLTHFLPRAGNPDPVLACGVGHSFQEIRVVLGEAQVVVGAHVDDIVQCPPS